MGGGIISFCDVFLFRHLKDEKDSLPLTMAPLLQPFLAELLWIKILFQFIDTAN
jgi:hypothetical protein